MEKSIFVGPISSREVVFTQLGYYKSWIPGKPGVLPWGLVTPKSGRYRVAPGSQKNVSKLFSILLVLVAADSCTDAAQVKPAWTQTGLRSFLLLPSLSLFV